MAARTGREGKPRASSTWPSSGRHPRSQFGTSFNPLNNSDYPISRMGKLSLEKVLSLALWQMTEARLKPRKSGCSRDALDMRNSKVGRKKPPRGCGALGQTAGQVESKPQEDPWGGMGWGKAKAVGVRLELALVCEQRPEGWSRPQGR